MIKTQKPNDYSSSIPVVIALEQFIIQAKIPRNFIDKHESVQ